ncbi:hypothetical protein BE17_51985 [Sorangium cellulosum]|uniref:Uncharacterized protein n=1 Tax=Sorangium cellulosum TaxID=56 RepID=A0A150RMX2_SORCE|nr:hypothetical protein BE17_51985 [Sorangium cellulosum]
MLESSRPTAPGSPRDKQGFARDHLGARAWSWYAPVDEARAIRGELAKECGHDLHALFAAFRRFEADSATDHVSLVSRREWQTPRMERIP